ncbi:MAG: helix-turn-helix domain-containing protein [Desulfosoma sp.]|uniref:helix-turn-helix domain-containing protein n=1 Tax=Desulfosoma sp. TaxID=2603217 RepID=UPI00404AE276
MDGNKWLTIEEPAACLKMGRTKLYRMAQEGDISASMVGNQWRCDREDFDLWMKSQGPGADKVATGGTKGISPRVLRS